jgi:hypothetical protein
MSGVNPVLRGVPPNSHAAKKLRAAAGGYECNCGTRTTTIKSGAPVCDRCAAIEARLFEYHPQDRLNTTAFERRRMTPFDWAGSVGRMALKHGIAA